MFPCQNCWAHLNIVISYAKRKTMNKLCLDMFASGERLNVQLADELVNQVFFGCALKGNTTKRQVTNRAFYQCVGWMDKAVTIRDLESEVEVLVKVEDIKSLRLGWAITQSTVNRQPPSSQPPNRKRPSGQPPTGQFRIANWPNANRPPVNQTTAKCQPTNHQLVDWQLID